MNLQIKIVFYIYLMISLLGEKSFGSDLIYLKQRVVLLISVSNFNKAEYQPIMDSIAKNFYNRFSKDFDVRTVFQADSADLFKALNDKNNSAVFWVSHSTSRQGISGMNLDGRIVDSKNVDVSRVFTKVHSKLKWLGVIGCKSLPIFNKYSHEGTYNMKNLKIIDTAFKFNTFLVKEDSELLNSKPDLLIAASSDLAEARWDAQKNFSQALTYLQRRRSQEIDFLDSEFEQEDPSQKSFDLTILRENDIDPDRDQRVQLGSVQILHNNKIIYVFPALSHHEEVHLNIPLEENENIENIKFVVDSGLNPESKTKEFSGLGSFKIWSHSLNKEWTLIKLNGKPLGVNQHIYKLENH